MITLETIQNQISSCQNVDRGDLSKREHSALEKKIHFLYQCRLYVETGPSEEFIKKQLDQVENRISSVDRNFAQWLSNNKKEAESVKNPKTKYHSVMGYKTLKEQRKLLKYLIE